MCVLCWCVSKGCLGWCLFSNLAQTWLLTSEVLLNRHKAWHCVFSC